MRIRWLHAPSIATLCAAVAACGARSTLDGAPVAGASTGTGAGGTAPVDGGATCPNAKPAAYLCDDDSSLYTFDPVTLDTTKLGAVSCPTDATPWTMTVDGAGAAYLIYDDWRIYRVDLATLACTATPYAPGQLGFTGEEGIAVAPVNGVPRFFVYGASPTPTLAVTDLTSFVLSPVGLATGASGLFPVAIQGDAFGRLYALSSGGMFFFEMGSATADVSNLAQTSPDDEGNWGIMVYGTQIYLFDGDGAVSLYDPAAKKRTALGSVGFPVIGASATPCVP